MLDTTRKTKPDFRIARFAKHYLADEDFELLGAREYGWEDEKKYMSGVALKKLLTEEHPDTALALGAGTNVLNTMLFIKINKLYNGQMMSGGSLETEQLAKKFEWNVVDISKLPPRITSSLTDATSSTPNSISSRAGTRGPGTPARRDVSSARRSY